ncbi:MAG: P-loop NTPase fold protein [Myxococcota bacterium]
MNTTAWRMGFGMVLVFLCFALVGTSYEKFVGSYRKWRAKLFVLTLLFTLGGLVSLAALVKLTSPAGFVLGAGLPLLWAAGLGWMGTKLVFLYRFSRRAWVEYPEHFDVDRRDGIELMESQQAFLEGLERLVEEDGRSANGIIAINGTWGGGKSFLLKRFVRRVERLVSPPRKDEASAETGDEEAPRQDPLHVVWVNVWRHQTDPHLQYAIYTKLLAHPRILFGRPGWRRYPLSLLGAELWMTLGHYFRRIRLSFQQSALDLHLAVPLHWQARLERAIGRNRAVFVLDEIDRATPAIAQAALTLARRSLDLPGVTVLLPYVPDQITAKAFSPLAPAYSPDLGSTMEAMLFRDALARDSFGSDEHAPERLVIDDPRKGHAGHAGRSYDDPRRASPSGPCGPAVNLTQVLHPAPDGEPSGPPGKPQGDERPETLRSYLVHEYLRWLGQNRLVHDRFAERAQEKYLGRRVGLPAVRTRELARAFVRKVRERSPSDAGGTGSPADAWIGTLEEICEEAFERAVASTNGRERAIALHGLNLRRLFGLWGQVLTADDVTDWIQEAKLGDAAVIRQIAARAAFMLHVSRGLQGYA